MNGWLISKVLTYWKYCSIIYCIQYYYVLTNATNEHHTKCYKNHMKMFLWGTSDPFKMQLIWLNWQWVYNIHMYHNQTKYFTGISQILFTCFFFMCAYVFKSFILETQSTYVQCNSSGPDALAIACIHWIHLPYCKLTKRGHRIHGMHLKVVGNGIHKTLQLFLGIHIFLNDIRREIFLWYHCINRRTCWWDSGIFHESRASLKWV